MNRKSEVITIDGVPYTVQEMPAKTMLPIVQKMADKPGDYETQLEMMSACLLINGEPVDAGELGTSIYMQLMSAVMSINGLDKFGDDAEKKD